MMAEAHGWHWCANSTVVVPSTLYSLRRGPAPSPSGRQRDWIQDGRGVLSFSACSGLGQESRARVMASSVVPGPARIGKPN
jgi:hypothetical protein